MTESTKQVPRSRLGRVAAFLLGLVPDAAFIVGVTLIYIGVRDVHPPAAKIVLGTLILFAGWRLAR